MTVDDLYEQAYPTKPNFASGGYTGTSGDPVGTVHDAVSHPAHYTAYKGLEIIDLTEQMNFNKGNAIKYIARAGLKDPSKEVEDLSKAVWYLNREISRINAR